MTPYYSAYTILMAVRDTNLIQTALLAAGFVISWFSIRLFPWKRIQAALRGLYLTGGLAMYLAMLVLSSRS